MMFQMRKKNKKLFLFSQYPISKLVNIQELMKTQITKTKKTENLNLNLMQTKRIEIKPRHCCVHWKHYEMIFFSKTYDKNFQIQNVFDDTMVVEMKFSIGWLVGLRMNEIRVIFNSFDRIRLFHSLHAAAFIVSNVHQKKWRQFWRQKNIHTINICE